MKRWLKSRFGIIYLATAIALVATVVGVSVDVEEPSTSTRGQPQISMDQVVFTIGPEVAYAAGVADYSCDGTADDVQFQAALDALPVGGGKLVVFAGTYVFASTVSRAIDNVVVQGVGRATSISNDGFTPIFSVGSQSNWTFRDLRVDAGGITQTSGSYVTLTNVWEGAAYWAYDTSHDVGPASWDVPTGRGATLVVAASNSDVQSIAQADYWCDGTADNVEIQAALNAVPSSGGAVLLMEGTYYIVSSVNVAANKQLLGEGYGALIRPAVPGTMTPWFVNLYADSVVSNLRLDAMSTGMGDANLDVIAVYGNNARIEGNWITGARNAGIDVSTGINNTRILSNRVWDTRCHSIWLGINSTHAVVSDNVIENALASGFGTDAGAFENVISNNSFVAPSHLAMEVTGGLRNVIEGNVLSGGGLNDGIRLQAESYENTVKNNVIVGFVDGIDLTDSDYNLVAGNLVKNNTQDGIRLTTSDYNRIVDNRATDDQGVPTQDHGLNVVSGTGNVVLDNDLSGLHTVSDFADTGTDTRGREVWAQMNYTTGAWSAQLNYAAALLAVNGQRAGATFHVPDDYNGVITAEIVLIPITGGVNEDIDIQSTYAAPGEANNTHAEADAASTYNLTAGDMSSISITGIMTSIAAGDFIGVQIIDNVAGSDAKYVLGIRLVYA